MDESGRPEAATPGESGHGTGHGTEPTRPGNGWAPADAAWADAGWSASGNYPVEPADPTAAVDPAEEATTRPAPWRPAETAPRSWEDSGYRWAEPPGGAPASIRSANGYAAEHLAGSVTGIRPSSGPPPAYRSERSEPDSPALDRLAVPAQRPAPESNPTASPARPVSPASPSSAPPRQPTGELSTPTDVTGQVRPEPEPGPAENTIAWSARESDRGEALRFEPPPGFQPQPEHPADPEPDRPISGAGQSVPSWASTNAGVDWMTRPGADTDWTAGGGTETDWMAGTTGADRTAGGGAGPDWMAGGGAGASEREWPLVPSLRGRRRREEEPIDPAEEESAQAAAVRAEPVHAEVVRAEATARTAGEPGLDPFDDRPDHPASIRAAGRRRAPEEPGRGSGSGRASTPSTDPEDYPQPPAPALPAYPPPLSPYGPDRYASPPRPPVADRPHATAVDPTPQRRPESGGETLPQRIPAEPDVPTVPEPPTVEPSAETPELARIATHLRRDEPSPSMEERPDGFDVQAILAAVQDVPGVREGKLRTTPAGAHSLRLELADGADPADVSRQVARLLQERMGLAAAPQNTSADPPRPVSGGAAPRPRLLPTGSTGASRAGAAGPPPLRATAAAPSGPARPASGPSGVVPPVSGPSAVPPAPVPSGVPVGAGPSGVVPAGLATPGHVPAPPRGRSGATGSAAVTGDATAPGAGSSPTPRGTATGTATPVAPLGGDPSEAGPEAPRRRRQGPFQGAAPAGDPGEVPDAEPQATAGALSGTSYAAGQQLSTTESAPSRPLNPGGPPGPRVIIDHVQVSTFGLEASVEVSLSAEGQRATGVTTGPAVDGYVLRLCAASAASAVGELLRSPDGTPDRGRCFVEHAAVLPFGSCEVATVVVFLVCDGWVEQLAGSALVSGDPRQAVVRATLAAVNRRLEALLA